ncbi:DUF3667 domain-containing protein [Tenacibaculum sp. TC6]|uniref:DUF3667 domain-containing protein n=1 Tax=Tenacibaculum sp. TC6 TaxID=3423223 RepID=UPI003D36F55D
MIKRSKALAIKDLDCLNCGYPFSGHEKFCPDCGQENKGSRITFLHFMHEIFRGFFSWDAKFWKTLFPLLISPGKVSKDYISGKRNRYSNPFRFYLTVSVLFFLLLSASETYKKINSLNEKTSSEENIELNLTTINNVDTVNKDSLTQALIQDIEHKQSLAAKKLKDSAQKNPITVEKAITKKYTATESLLGGNKLLDTFIKFNKVNPTLKTDAALSQLHLPKNFSNRFWYSRAIIINKIAQDKEERTKFLQQMVSLGSIALFILLPLFSLSLKIIYIRRKFTYVEHLIFVFHVQTVFFLLLIIFFLLDLATPANIENTSFIFFSLFALYLYLAMKKFYDQGYFKTFFKFCLANFFFMFLTAIGITTLSAIVFALY